MAHVFANKTLLLIFDTVLFLLCIAGVEQSRQKAWIHAEIQGDHGAIHMDSARVTSVHPDEKVLQPNDVIISIAGYRLMELADVEQVVDSFEKGSSINVTYRRGSHILEARYTLGEYYSTFEMLMQAGGVLIFFALGLFVLSQKPDGPEALLFHQLAVTVAGVIAFTHGHFMMEPVGIGHILRALLPSTYIFLGTFVLHFSLLFPKARILRRWKLVTLYTPAVLLTVAGVYTSYRATIPFNLQLAQNYYDVLSAAKLSMVVGSFAAIVVMLRSFRSTRDAIARKQIAWVVSGVGFSILVYVFAWLLTTSYYARALLPASINTVLDSVRIDESLLILSLILTASFVSIGIIRYRFFDIEFFFRRSTVAALVAIAILFVYTAVVLGISKLSALQTPPLFFVASLIGLMVALLLYTPVRRLLQRIVDVWFFRVEYDFREGLTAISREISDSVDAKQVAEVLVRGIDRLMHLQGVMVLKLRDRRTLDVLAYTGFPRWNATTVQVNERRLRAIPRKPMVLEDVMENGTDVVELRMPFAERFGVVLILSIHSEEGDVLGLLVLGNKRTGTRFTLEDMDLLHSLTTQAGLHLERLRLQETLLLEKEEAARLRELSQMKSYFVSGVSHDLKTPLTSIKLFAELLEEQVPDDDTGAKKYVGIIQGECDRLGRLINNVLDFTKIERGMMKYRLEKTDLNDVMRRAWDVMQYQFSMGGFSCEVQYCDESVIVRGDTDALIEVVTNLLSNAMKYSGRGKKISLRTRCSDDRVFLEVEDQGLGIAPEEHARLFEPFYRSHTGDVQKHGGVGLGLALVKHIVDAHDGQVQVQSTLGQGSIFTVSFHAMEAV